jgi:hypothetical protein
MNKKSTLALTAALGACLLTAASVSYAETQSEWLQRQLEVSDGYAPPFARAGVGTAPAGETAIRVPAANTNAEATTKAYPERKASGSAPILY